MLQGLRANKIALFHWAGVHPTFIFCFDLHTSQKILKSKQLLKTRWTTLNFSYLIWKMHCLLWSFSGQWCDVRGSPPTYHHLVFYILNITTNKKLIFFVKMKYETTLNATFSSWCFFSQLNLYVLMVRPSFKTLRLWFVST